MKLEDYSFLLAQLISDISTTHGRIVRESDFVSWVERYNAIVSDLNAQLERDIPMYILPDDRIEASFHSIRISNKAIDNLKRAIMLLRKTIDDLAIHENECSNRFYCFKINSKCPHKIDSKKYLFFVGMPFAPEYNDSFQYGIKKVFEDHGINSTERIFKADEKFSTSDIFCKICRAIQESQYIIINISGQNPNVMLELGLAYGLNKRVFLIKDQGTEEISDLKGLEYIGYSNATDLANKLQKNFREQGII